MVRDLMVIGVVLAGLLGCAHAPVGTPVPSPESFIGETMSFEAERLDAPGTLRLSDLRGKVVLIDVFASWCVPCRDAVPAWGELRARIGDELAVVGVAIDGERAMALGFIDEVAPRFPTVWDARGDIMARYPVENMPTLFMLDRDGVVRFVHVGFQPDAPAVVEAHVRALLGADRGADSPGVSNRAADQRIGVRVSAP